MKKLQDIVQAPSFGKRNGTVPLDPTLQANGKLWFAEAREQSAREEREANSKRQGTSDSDWGIAIETWLSSSGGDGDSGGD